MRYSRPQVGDELFVTFDNETESHYVTNVIGQYIIVGTYKFHYSDDFYTEDEMWRIDRDGETILISPIN